MAPTPTPKPSPGLYGLDPSGKNTNLAGAFKGFIDFTGKPGSGYSFIPKSTMTSPIPFSAISAPSVLPAIRPGATPTPTKPPTTMNAQGQAGAWSTNYGTTADAERARLLAGQQTTGGMTTGGVTGGTVAAPQGFTADQLYIDPTSAYQPVLDQYAAQQAQLQDRYGANAADIKNIFGNLSTVRALDKTKIAQQYQTSIQQQQDALAARTAETRMATQAGQEGAATAAGELGTAGQPAPTDSLTAQAAEQGVADSNAYQTTWAALQNVMSQQAQNDVQNAIQGYDYQQTSALEQLRNNLEDRLAGINQNMAGTESQLAQAKIAGKQTVANAKYGEAQDAKAQAAALAAAQAKASAKPTSYPKTVTGWQQKVNDLGFIPNDITSSIQYAKTLAGRAINANLSPTESRKVPTKAQIWDYWMKNNGGADETAVALEYLNLLPK